MGIIKSRRLSWAGHVACMEENRTAKRIMVGNPKGKRPLGRPRRRWADNVKLDLSAIGINNRNWGELAKDRDIWRGFVSAVMGTRAYNAI